MSDDKKVNPDRIEKRFDDKFAALENSLIGKLDRLSNRGQQTGTIKDGDTCYYACPECKTRLCKLKQGHSGKHECDQGHDWL